MKMSRTFAVVALLLIGFGVAFGQLSQSLIRQKLHPTFQAVVTSDGQNLLSKFGGRPAGPTVTLTNGRILFDAIITTTNSDAIRAKGIHVNSAFGKYATAQLTREDILNLIQLAEVQYIDPGSINYPTLDRSLPETGANLLHSGFLNNTPYKGKGVIVLIYDSGIDWRHLDFRDPVDTTKSRILAIWDQTISPMSGETNPSGFDYGVEYTKQQIEREFTVSPPRFVREKDINGHGTHVAGIAAGNGNGYNKKYVGVAPEADIVVVKGGDGTYGEVKMLQGLMYAQNKALYYGKPIVVNWSIGGQGGAHDGTRPYEVAVDNFSSTPGRAVAIAAGNDGGRKIHAGGVVSPSSPASFTLNVPAYTPTSGTNNDEFFLGIWLGSNTSVTATIVSPSGVTYGRNAGESGTSTNSSDGTIDLYNDVSIYNGLRNVWAYVHDESANVPKSGTWTITLSGASGSTSYDAWLSSWTVGTATVALVGGNNQKTVTLPGTSNTAVTVASHVTKNQWPTYAGNVDSDVGLIGDISSSSGVGPTRDGRQKPDIAAPGRVIASSLSSDVTIGPTSNDLLPGFKHQMMMGTSMAAPHVTGAIALLLSLSPNLTGAQIKSILTSTTNTDLFTSSTPNMSWGYGKLDVLRAALTLLSPSGRIQRKTYSYDLDGTSYYILPYLTGGTKYAVRFTPASSGIVTGVEVNLAWPANNAIIGNGSLVCEVFTNIPGSVAGIPGARIGNSTQLPFSRLSTATNNFIDLSSAGVAVTAGQDYHIVLSVANPLDQLTVLEDNGTGSTNRSSVFNGSKWTNVALYNFRVRTVVTSLFNPVPPTSVEQQSGEIPKDFALSQNFPNPFNPTTTIQFAVPKSSHVNLKVFDALGREVVTLVSQQLASGNFTVRWQPNVPSGIYFYRLQAEDASTGSVQGFVETKKMILLK
jgi:subtilisin family serine protease